MKSTNLLTIVTNFPAHSSRLPHFSEFSEVFGPPKTYHPNTAHFRRYDTGKLGILRKHFSVLSSTTNLPIGDRNIRRGPPSIWEDTFLLGGWTNPFSKDMLQVKLAWHLFPQISVFFWPPGKLLDLKKYYPLKPLNRMLQGDFSMGPPMLRIPWRFRVRKVNQKSSPMVVV